MTLRVAPDDFCIAGGGVGKHLLNESFWHIPNLMVVGAEQFLINFS